MVELDEPIQTYLKVKVPLLSLSAVAQVFSLEWQSSKGFSPPQKDENNVKFSCGFQQNYYLCHPEEAQYLPTSYNAN